MEELYNEIKTQYTSVTNDKSINLTKKKYKIIYNCEKNNLNINNFSINLPEVKAYDQKNIRILIFNYSIINAHIIQIKDNFVFLKVVDLVIKCNVINESYNVPLFFLKYKINMIIYTEDNMYCVIQLNLLLLNEQFPSSFIENIKSKNIIYFVINLCTMECKYMPNINLDIVENLIKN